MDDEQAFALFADALHNSNPIWKSEEFGAKFPALFQRVVSFLVAAIPSPSDVEFVDSDVDIVGGAIEIVALVPKVFVYVYFDDDNEVVTRAWRRSELKELIVDSAPIVHNDPNIPERPLKIRAIYFDSNGDSHHSFPMQDGNRSQTKRIPELYRSLFADLQK